MSRLLQVGCALMFCYGISSPAQAAAATDAVVVARRTASKSVSKPAVRTQLGVRPAVVIGDATYTLSWHQGDLWEFALPGEQTAGNWSRMFAVRLMGAGTAKDLDKILALHVAGAEKRGAQVLLKHTLPKTKKEPAVRVLVNVHPLKEGQPGELDVFAIRGRGGRAIVSWLAIKFRTQEELDALQQKDGIERLVAFVAKAILPTHASLLAIPPSKD